MSVTILQRSRQGIRSIKVSRPAVIALVCLLGLLPVVAGFAGYTLARYQGYVTSVNQGTIDGWKEQLGDQWQEIEVAKRQTQQKIDALTARLGLLQAHVRRLDAAGERIAEMSGIDAKEFGFGETPAIGGPEMLTDAHSSVPDLIAALNDLDSQLISREQQLSVLESLLLDKQMGIERYISGRPISKGWISSFYGRRNDPFTGRPDWHAGIDFAGKEGSDVVATAAGVVSFVGERYGYGLLVEINHGDGLVTRYGHNLSAEVEEGQVISKGHIIAKMGNSGRSTGAHVHYEVLKDNRKINPLPFVNRRARG